jgi:ankyrin repeat protein
MTPLHLACTNDGGADHAEAVVSLLLAHRADPLLTSSLGVTPLNVAAATSFKILQLLLDAVKTSSNEKKLLALGDQTDAMPLLGSACLRSELEACQEFLHVGVDVAAVDSLSSTTPLMLAAVQDCPKIVKTLLDWGADESTRCNGLTASDYALYSGSTHCLPLLSVHHAILDDGNSTGKDYRLIRTFLFFPLQHNLEFKSI